MHVMWCNSCRSKPTSTVSEHLEARHLSQGIPWSNESSAQGHTADIPQVSSVKPSEEHLSGRSSGLPGTESPKLPAPILTATAHCCCPGPWSHRPTNKAALSGKAALSEAALSTWFSLVIQWVWRAAGVVLFGFLQRHSVLLYLYTAYFSQWG